MWLRMLRVILRMNLLRSCMCLCDCLRLHLRMHLRLRLHCGVNSSRSNTRRLCVDASGRILVELHRI